MHYRRLGRTDIEVSSLCLGTMTWGSQNSFEEATAQIELALAAGVNFIDTAEMYPTTPLRAETFGDTERMIGRWLNQTGRRHELILASKVLGNGRDDLDGGGDITAEKFRTSLDNSLQRLGTDCIDLYQMHWPNRGSYHFRQHWKYDPSSQSTEAVEANIIDVLEAAQGAIRQGKIRALGLSNETAWGTQRFASLAERHGLPRVVSIQNEYNLLVRHFDLDLAEVSHHEDIGLLAFTPLAAGMLSGKYEAGAVPAGSRRALNPDLNGRWTEQARAAAAEYATLARDSGCEPAVLALAFALSRPFMTSVIIGATDTAQLQTNLAAAHIQLTRAQLDAIDEIRRRFPMPM